jgi:hypothetical protein
VYCRGNRNRAGFRSGLQARGNIWGISEHVGLGAAVLAYHHRARVNSNANRQLNPLFRREPSVERRHLVHDRKASADGDFSGRPA